VLVNFSVKNFRSFYKEKQLSMQVTINKEFAELNTFKLDGKLSIASGIGYFAMPSQH